MTEPTVWHIRRNCSGSPRLLAAVFGSLVVVSLGFGMAFAAQGFWMVLPFVGLELAAVALAFLCYARHAVDHERIELAGGWLRLYRFDGRRQLDYLFDLPCVRVEGLNVQGGPGSGARIELVAARQRVEVGRHLVEERRQALGREIRAALAAARRGGQVVSRTGATGPGGTGDVN